MTTDPVSARWRRLSELFERAIDLEPEARGVLLDVECAGDPGLRDELERMLAADASANAFDAGAAAAVDLQAIGPHQGDDDEARASVGARLGHWVLEGMLGRGGMGTVYAARRDDRDTLQRAALKRLHRRWDGSLQAQRFLQERRILAALSHPNIPHLIDHGLDDDGRPWFALELVEGKQVTAWADARRLDLRERIALFRGICAAVQHAHEHFVVHRDLKPGNILVDDEGHPKVLDFGVAKRIDDAQGATRTGAFVGFTPEYAAPEQISGGAISAATDVYALGVILYQLLAGRLPHTFDHDDLRATTEAISTQSAERLDQAITIGTPHEVSARLAQRGTDLRGYRRFVRGDLSRILQTALAKEAPRRYASVQAFSGDLERFLAGRTVSVGGDTFAYRARKFVRRNRWGVAMATLAGIALLGGIAGVAMKTRQVQAEAARANREATHATREAARAEREAARARVEVERMAASNEFMRSVFSGAEPNNAGTPNISLRAALDLALKQLESDPAQDPQVRVRFLLAASTSYEALGETGKAEATAREALRIQQHDLPASKEDRARALASLAWLRMNYEPKQSLAWAKQALALQLANEPSSDSGIREAYSVLANAQYANNNIPAAVETNRRMRRYMLDNGMPEEHQDVITSWSNEAVMLSGLGRFDEAIAAHEAVIRLRAKSVGADSVATWLERVYFGFTLNRAKRYREALAQFEIARPGLRRELGAGHDSVQQANLGLGRALLGLGRAADALAPLAAAHAFGRTHGFEERQDVVGHAYARALATLDRCKEAGAVLAELARSGIALPADQADPLQGTRCR
jgi:eukaryotic-like serine/threonine-protein kinase